MEGGSSKDTIFQGLRNAGWQESDINQAFAVAQPSSIPTQPEERGAPLSNYSPVQPSGRKISKKALIAIIAVGVLLVAGGVFGYFYYFKEAPEQVFAKMLANTSALKTFEYEGELVGSAISLSTLSDSFLLPAEITEEGEATFVFKGTSDLRDPKNKNQALELNIKTEIEEEVSINFGFELRVINSVIYFKLNDAPSLGGFIDLSFLSNQWIKIDIKAIGEQFGLNTEGLEEQINSIQEEQNLSPEQKEAIRNILLKGNVFALTKEFSGEKINGISTHHLGFKINKEELQRAIIEIEKVLQQELNSEQAQATLGLDEYINENIDFYDSITGEIWIGKNDYLPYKLTTAIKFNDASVNQEVTAMDLILLLKNHNQPVHIEPPPSPKSIEEILEEFSAGTLDVSPSQPSVDSAFSKARDTRRIVDILQISAALEIYYDDNNAYPSRLSSLLPNYITTIPTDPQSGRAYNYNSVSCTNTNQEYVIASRLEDGTNSKLYNDTDGMQCAVNCIDPVFCLMQ